MDSHILNMYHQARYRSIGHNMMRSTSNSVSSESSCNQNSPEYSQQQSGYREHEEENYEARDWCIASKKANTTQSSQDSSSDEEEESIVQEVPYNDRAAVIHYGLPSSEVEVVEENSLVEGDDYDVIQVYAVHPDLDLEVSSDDEDKEYEKVEYSEGEYGNIDDNSNYEQQNNRHFDVVSDSININLDAPVVSNVDEYFIKDKILEIKDEPVVKDVDEYFIKDVDESKTPNIDDFFIKEKPVEAPFQIDKSVPNIDDFFIKESKSTNQEGQQNGTDQDNADISINESDLVDVLPNIEDIRKYFLEDTPCSKLKNVQRSCSVPHSPMNICMDIDDAKTCLSFEDLNLDLSDLPLFDNDKGKSDSSANKSDDIPRTLTDEDINSFLITNKTQMIKSEDDFSQQDMEIDPPVESSLKGVHEVAITKSRKNHTSTPLLKPAVLEYCIEKTNVKKEPAIDIKVEVEDFVDVESCNDTVIPVLAANNLNSLLEQFEATEKLNTKKRPVLKVDEHKAKIVKNSLTSGTRLQDAGVQLNKNKMRQILMPPIVNSAVARRSPSPLHSDHDYCSSKKRHSLPTLKRGQSLLKPEVLSSNNRILNSRHRSCKNKKIVYHLSSDEESEKCNINAKNKKVLNNRDDIDVKVKKSSVKQPVKPVTLAISRKKLDDSVVNDSGKSNNSVMNKTACKASDTPCSQNSNGSIKLTIKNKSEVILNCDDKDSQKNNKYIDKDKSSSVNDKASDTVKSKPVKETKDLDSTKNKIVNSSENIICAVKEEPRSKDENFYTALFSNKQDVQIPQSMQIKSEKLLFEEELQRISEETIKKELEQPTKKKKLNLQEYKMRRVNSNTSSATVSPEAIFPDMPNMVLDKISKPVINYTAPIADTAKRIAQETSKDVFDPIREASRKILLNTKKQKAEAMRKRDEDIVMSKIPKVETLQLQPLISDAEMMKIVGFVPPVEPATTVPEVPDKPQPPSDYEEIVLVSVGTNTDENVFKQFEKSVEKAKRKAESPPVDTKSLINFKIKKTEHILKQNVFDTVKKDKKSPVGDKKHTDPKIDRERYKDITAALKSVEKQQTKISSNSLFASIQDVVLKKAPDENERKSSKLSSPTEKKATFVYTKTVIVKDYDTEAEHGEDKIILHLEKQRTKPVTTSIIIQTDAVPEYIELMAPNTSSKEKVVNRKRNDSDMSMSSDGSSVRAHKDKVNKVKIETNAAVKPRIERVEKRSLSKEKRSKRSLSKDKCSRSKDRYESKYRRRSRSGSRSRRRRISHSRSRSRSRGRYRRYRRSDSPYKRKRSRSPYSRKSSSRRSPPRSEHRNRSRTPRRDEPTSSKSPITKKPKHSPVLKSNSAEKKIVSMTPPLRKPTFSESSYSSSSSSSSSSSEDSQGSQQSSSSSYKRDELYKKPYRSYSSEECENNTPVEERRIVFVGKLEKDVNKTTLRGQFSKFGTVMEVRLHNKEDGSRYGFVTFKHACDAWTAVESASTFPQYDVGFGGRRAFCRQSYADLDGLEAKYTESAFHGQAAIPARRPNDLSFEEMLLEMKKKLSQRKNEKKHLDDPKP